MIRLFRSVPPIWIQKPVSQSAVEGQPVQFSCQARGVPTPDIQWKVKSGRKYYKSDYVELKGKKT